MPLEELNTLSAVKEAIDEEKPDTLILVYAYYNFCAGCWKIMPVFLDIMAGLERNARWLLTDVGDALGATSYFNIKHVPTFIAIKAGRELGRYSGINKHKLRRFVVKMIDQYGLTGLGREDEDPDDIMIKM